jgi:formylglycine-generating enzyme required for sulfatase activity
MRRPAQGKDRLGHRAQDPVAEDAPPACGGCCATGDRPAPPPAPRADAGVPRPPEPALPKSEAVDVPGGTALVGTEAPLIAEDGEGPLRRVRLRPFRIGAATVTNAEFAAFVAATGHRSDAERYGWSFVFWAQLGAEAGPTAAVAGHEWWRKVEGAFWFQPTGPGSAAQCLPDHPVVHVSWNDARAYAAWAGGRLPTEAEWEHAARGGRGDVRYPWGDAEPDDAEFLPCNIWQGRFPHANSAADGFAATAPARSFAPNGYGLYNMVGNVWEWSADAFRIRSLRRQAQAQMKAQQGFRIMKGGSFLCHRSYCHRYRIAARSASAPDSTTSHQGFRVVWDR